MMLYTAEFEYRPLDNEKEKASNSYLMSLFAMFVGLPLPIFNLIATLIFYLGNRKSTYFVRWHCTQALISQLTLFFFNSLAFWLVIFSVFNNVIHLNAYIIVYFIVVVLINLAELAMTIITSIDVRKGLHIKWMFYGRLTDRFCKP